MNTLKQNILLVVVIVGAGLLYFLFLRRPTSTITPPADSEEQDEYALVTLLPKDAIPSIDDPHFYSANAADAEYAPDELVIGVSINGDHRAYSTPLLSRHEIVNDVVGGEPLAVTW